MINMLETMLPSSVARPPEDDCMQMVIFLYLLDNETSKVVLFSAGIGTLIEFWKVTKAMKVSLDWSTGFPLPKFEDKAGTPYSCVHCLMRSLTELWSLHCPNHTPLCTIEQLGC